MKKILAIVMMILAVVMVGCNSEPKSRIAEKFENYVSANFVEPSDYKGIVSIVCTDSIDVLGTITEFSSMIDSLNEMRAEYLSIINSNLPKCSYSFKMAHAVEYAGVMMGGLSYTLSTPNRKGCLFTKRQELLSASDSTRTLSKFYTIKAKIKGNVEITTYYAVDCALIDTVLISSNPIKISDAPYPLNGIFALIDEYKEYCATDLERTEKLCKMKNEVLIESQGK